MPLTASRARFWKRYIPQTMRDALDKSLDHALESRNLSVERVAVDHLGQPNKWSLYKWVESAKLPASIIRPFEIACGVPLVTRYLAASNNLILLDIPIGKAATPKDIQTLQAAGIEAAGALLSFYSGQCDEQAVLEAVTANLQELAWHRANIVKFSQPELELNHG